MDTCEFHSIAVLGNSTLPQTISQCIVHNPFRVRWHTYFTLHKQQNCFLTWVIWPRIDCEQGNWKYEDRLGKTKTGIFDPWRAMWPMSWWTRRMKRSLRKIPVALMIVNLVVRTPESIVSFGFCKFLCFWGSFFLFSTCILTILVCKHSEMMYSSILQFYWILNEACGRSNDGENCSGNCGWNLNISQACVKWQFWKECIARTWGKFFKKSLLVSKLYLVWLYNKRIGRIYFRIKWETK